VVHYIHAQIRRGDGTDIEILADRSRFLFGASFELGAFLQGASHVSRSKWRMTQKRHCHARESGHPDLGPRAAALDSRFRGNDATSKDHILNDAPNGVLAGLHMPAVLGETTKTMDRSGVFHSGTG
jgi:hypothetical protein